MIKDDQIFPTALPDAQTNQPPQPPTISEADYEQMYKLLYAYRFGSVSFLELLDKIEAILHINSSQASRQTDPD